MWSSVSGKPAVLDCRCTLHGISCMLPMHTQRLNAKEKFTLFSHGNVSLLRQQPGARLDANYEKCIACQVASKLSIEPATDAKSRRINIGVL